MDSPLALIRYRYLHELRAAYLVHFEEGLVGAEALHVLQNSINEALDRAYEPLYDWQFLHHLTRTGCLFRCSLKNQKLCCIGRFVHKWVHNDIAFIYDVFQNYMTCSYMALELLMNLNDVDAGNIHIVYREIKQNLHYVKEELVNYRAGYPTLMFEVDTDHCEYYVLRQLSKYYKELEQTGQIEPKHLNMILHEIDHKIYDIKHKRKYKQFGNMEMILASQFGDIFKDFRSCEIALNSVNKADYFMVQPANLVIDKDDGGVITQQSVVDYLFTCGEKE